MSVRNLNNNSVRKPCALVHFISHHDMNGTRSQPYTNSPLLVVKHVLSALILTRLVNVSDSITCDDLVWGT